MKLADSSVLTLGCAYLFLPVVSSVSPYSILNDWEYALETRRSDVWPDCQFRFLSYTEDCESTVDLWDAVGVNQMFTLENAGNGTWFLKSNCGTLVSYSVSCEDNSVSFSSDSSKPHLTDISSTSSRWQLEPSSDLSWKLIAYDRLQCDLGSLYLTFSDDCEDHSVMIGTTNEFLLHPYGPIYTDDTMIHIPNTNYEGCADPFVWRDTPNGSEDVYFLTCTSGPLPLYYSDDLSPETIFTPIGYLLNDSQVEPPSWASNTDRWAPENLLIESGELAVVCDTDSDGVRRLGTVLNPSLAAASGAWSVYSTDFVNLGQGPAGEIDGHFFQDDVNDKSYLVYKSDDNSIGMAYTRIYAVEVLLPSQGADLVLLGEPQVILNSTGLWWVDSWVEGGSLIEGPEIIWKDGFYYLFFASGKYCTDSYAEGVARSSSSIWGPYEKLGVPVLSTNIVGNGIQGSKLVGPGHSSYVLKPNASLPSLGTETADAGWYSVWHASEGENCERNAYVDKLSWTADGWPVVEFTPVNETYISFMNLRKRVSKKK